MITRHPLSKILFVINFIIFMFSWVMVISVKGSIEIILKDMGIPWPLPTAIFIDYGYAIMVTTMIVVAIQYCMEVSKMKQKKKIKILMASSFFGLVIMAFYVIAVFMPFIFVTRTLGESA